jgi:hypothetical protein
MTSILARLKQWFSAGANERPVQTENRKSHELRCLVIAAFGEYIEREPPPADEIRDVNALPFAKAQILEALCLEIALSEDESEAEAMMAAAHMLADFQEGVGELPVTQLGSDFSAKAGQVQSTSPSELLALAASIANKPDQGRYEEFRARGDAELIQIRAKLMAADTVRRGMSPEKKLTLRE